MIGSPRALHKFPPDDPATLLEQLAVASIDGMPPPRALSFDNHTARAGADRGQWRARSHSPLDGVGGNACGSLGDLRSWLPAEPANGDKEAGRPPSGDDADVHPVKARAEKAGL
jgi:hypothetical protein